MGKRIFLKVRIVNHPMLSFVTLAVFSLCLCVYVCVLGQIK